MKLGFDLDGVVVNLLAEIDKYAEIKYGIKKISDFIVNHRFNKCVFSQDKEFNEKIITDLISVVNDAEFQSKADPVEGAQDVLYKLKKAGHKIYFITARYKQNQPATFKWLRKNNIIFDGLYVVGENKHKGVCGRKLNIDMFVDDVYDNLKIMLEHKKLWRKGLLLMDAPYNYGSIDTDKFKRVKNWGEILRHVGIENR